MKRWTDRGFGFIQGEDGNEYFVHFSSINADGFKSLAEGELTHGVPLGLQVRRDPGTQSFPHTQRKGIQIGIHNEK